MNENENREHKLPQTITETQFVKDNNFEHENNNSNTISSMKWEKGPTWK